jgi:hypothetical protein
MTVKVSPARHKNLWMAKGGGYGYKFILETHLTQSILEILKILLIIDIKGLLETTYF